MNRTTAIDAYHRAKAWEQRQSQALVANIVRDFGMSICMHNACVSWDYGKPWPELVAKHGNYRKLARRYEYQQRRIWDTCNRLCDTFAKYF